MDPKLGKTEEFLWRRLTEETPDLALLIPVLFGLGVVLLITLFRHEGRWKALLTGLAAVAAASVVYVPLAYLFKPTFSWLVVLVPVLGVALFYVGMMYFRDARSIHPLWAAFLGALRTCVYAILTLVFLLPGLQKYEEVVTYPKVLFLLDVSSSMSTKDDTPEANQDPATLPERQDRVLDFMFNPADSTKATQAPFIERVLSKTPLTAYRFGDGLDEGEIHSLQRSSPPKRDAWAAWLKPSKDNLVFTSEETDEKKRADERARRVEFIESLPLGTNIPGSFLQALKLENNSFLQAIVVLSDGQNNQGSDEALKEILLRTNNPKRPVPVFTVGIGEYRQPASIRIDDVQAPQVTRPDDKFPVRVPVVAQGLHDEEFTVELDVSRIKSGTSTEIASPTVYTLGPITGRFKGTGDQQQDLVDFEIDVQALTKIKLSDANAGELEGTWKVVARVPRHPREATSKEHVSEPVEVVVQKKKLRVLLFASGPTREYQFVRTLLYREVIENRAELSVFLQSGQADNVDQDVEKDRMLTRFPDKLGLADAASKHYSLNDYDVVVAFDPDWTALTPEQLNLLKEWVGTYAGGVIFVAGPVNSYQLARAGGRDISSLLTIFPVVLKDSRLHGLEPGTATEGHDARRPYLLNFTPTARDYEFLKLDESGASPTAGWDKFFWGPAGAPKDAANKDLVPRRGIHNFYPVDRIKGDSAVLATFAGPKWTRINEGKDEQPFLVSMRYGAGKTLYLGSGEMWRLRLVGNNFHERFWIKAARYVSAGATQQKKYGRILMARSYPVGAVNIEAQLKGVDLQPLSVDARPVVDIRRVGDKIDERKDKQSVALRSKPFDGDWQGWFNGSARITEPGEYEVRVAVEGTSESLVHRFTIRRPNPEVDNLRTNFDFLHYLASESGPVTARLPAELRGEVEQALRRSGKDGSRLFFTLANADSIAHCLQDIPPKRESVKGEMKDLWDQGFETGVSVSAYWFALLLPLGLGLLGGAILLYLGRTAGAALFAGAFTLVGLVPVVFDRMVPDLVWLQLPIDFSFVLVGIVTLLGVEWLTRKLLRLA